MSLLKSNGFVILKSFVIDKTVENIRLLKIFFYVVYVSSGLFTASLSVSRWLCVFVSI